MASYNHVTLLGNVTRDIELRHTQGGTAVCELGLAVNDRVKVNGDWVDQATFVDVTVWGRTAEIANEYLSKGSPVLISGRLKLDQWEKDGQKRSKLGVVADRLQLIGGGQGGGNGGGGGGGQRQSQPNHQGRQEGHNAYQNPQQSGASHHNDTPF